MNPNNGGMPAMDSEAAQAITAVMGMARAKPPSIELSLVPVEWSMMPAIMNRHALYSACTTRKTTMAVVRSEEHTSELQSRENLVCRLLLEKKKKTRRSCAAY